MRKVKKTIFLVLAMFILILNVKGTACGYEEKAKLNNEVANVKVNYEIKERVLDKSEYSISDALLGTEYEDEYEATSEYIQANLLNLTENMYVVVSNDFDKEEKLYQYSDTDKGSISIPWLQIDEIVTFTFKVYASDTTGCDGNLLKTLTLKLPRYNDYSTYDICNNFPEYYLCQRYVTYEEVGFDVFMDKVFKEADKKQAKEKEEEEKNSKWYNKAKNYVVEHKVPFIIGGCVLVVAGGATTFIIIRKRRRGVI